jgi:hypothetical protein
MFPRRPPSALRLVWLRPSNLSTIARPTRILARNNPRSYASSSRDDGKVGDISDPPRPSDSDFVASPPSISLGHPADPRNSFPDQGNPPPKSNDPNVPVPESSSRSGPPTVSNPPLTFPTASSSAMPAYAKPPFHTVCLLVCSEYPDTK